MGDPPPTSHSWGGFRCATPAAVPSEEPLPLSLTLLTNIAHTYGILAIGYSFADKFAVFLEGYAEKDYTQFNTGLTWVLNSETQLDITTGLLNFDSGYIGVGFARRFLFKKDE